MVMAEACVRESSHTLNWIRERKSPGYHNLIMGHDPNSLLTSPLAPLLKGLKPLQIPLLWGPSLYAMDLYLELSFYYF